MKKTVRDDGVGGLLVLTCVTPFQARCSNAEILGKVDFIDVQHDGGHVTTSGQEARDAHNTSQFR